ncbi:MAG: hypothetical protein PVF36_09210 [Desulfobacterales bacterium]|jgi:hypothetical protein
MYYKTETEFQYAPVILKNIADLPGGLMVDDTEYVGDEIREGSIMGKGSDGLAHLIKTVAMQDSATDSATALKTLKNHEFKVGDFIGKLTDATRAAYAITDIDTSNADYDTITIGTTLGIAMTAGDVLVQCLAESADAAVLKYTPKGISTRTASLKMLNQPTGIMIIGVVNSSTMPHAYDATLKALIPDIHFE